MKAIDYCVRVFDGTHDTPKPTEKGYKLITSKNILNRTLNLDDAYYISESDYISINKRSKVKQWDILFSMIGTVGNVYLEQNKDITYAIKNMGVFSCEDENKALWLYYYLQSPYFKQYLNSYLSGAVQKFVPLDFLRNIEVPDCTEETIRKCSVLSTLDRKISLNRSMNEELERMAKEIYDYWFVQFEFPDANGRPYKSSGGKMVYNPVLKREVPEGWEVKEVKDCIEPLQRGVSYTSESIENPNGYPMINLACYTKQGDYRTGEMKYFTGEVKEVHKAYPYDMLIACTDMTQGADVIGRPILATQEKEWFVYSMDLAKIVPATIEKMYLYYTLRTPFYHKYIKPFASGTTVKHLNTQGVEDYKIVIPCESVQLKFEAIISNIKKEQMLLTNSSLELESLRDELLPLLMTGQVKIK